jgi:hypothetical protein
MTYGISVMQYAPHSKAADEIERLCEEIVPRVAMEASQTQSFNPLSDYADEQVQNMGWDNYHSHEN